MSGHSMPCRQTFCIIHVWWCYSSFFAPPMSKHQRCNKGLSENVGLHPLISPNRSCGRRTPRSLCTLGLNAYVTANLFMKRNKGRRCKFRHICAFLMGRNGSGIMGLLPAAGKEGGVFHLCVLLNNINVILYYNIYKMIHSQGRFSCVTLLILWVLKAPKWRPLTRMENTFFFKYWKEIWTTHTDFSKTYWIFFSK